jgi:4-alpha-glucanotransferase
MLTKRQSGILAHITSLPGPFGVGDLGPTSHRFVDFLAAAGQTFWQVLPLNPTDPASGNAPYSSPSAFAGNPLLISPEKMVQDGLLPAADLESYPRLAEGRVSYEAAWKHKSALLEKAFQAFWSDPSAASKRSYDTFCQKNAFWLDDYALFRALKQKHHGRPWTQWPAPLRDRESEALETIAAAQKDTLARIRFRQYVFFTQLRALHEKCNAHDVDLLGDLPIYVSHDSADVWAHRTLFKLKSDGRRTAQAGVPPDYFSKTGQLWGNPVYRWDVLHQNGYKWWIERLSHSFELYDWVRIDHFRGFVGYWEVPAEHKTAQNGRWIEGPGKHFFSQLKKAFPALPVIAEDLGTITADVRALMAHFQIPGSKVLIFAFGGDFPQNAYAPHNLPPNAVVYTGTHDNNTVRGWLEDEASDTQKQQVFGYIGRRHTLEDAAWEFVRMALGSVARLSILPLQDLLGLDAQSRMNQPATTHGNWTWRLQPGQLSDRLAADLRELTWLTGRIPPQTAPCASTRS